MQNKINNQERGNMTQKIRMNTELRNKLFNKIKTRLRMRTLKNEKHIFNQENGLMKNMLWHTNLQKKLLRDHTNQKMLQLLELSKRNMEVLVMLLQKINAFTLLTSEDKDDEGDIKETKSHFDFGLFGNLNGSEYMMSEGKKFALAYFREDLKAMDCNPDIYAQQKENKENPHKTKHVDECLKALGKSGGGSYSSLNDNTWYDKSI